ncbi:hypothetical protein GT037_007618 [Alternaria burnsii]|uniref:Uncharacterized protein n=1 Tax=Alternaria burnsii TaxID=1187904 RepID=A0A8H7B5E4_9PLEO|nr:uncharacterized protein GT037_007618 [Alternaria burnsii]KAF7674858.1 hypothetical protein GT037_007618 [Alternaria burnsii]
MPDAGVPFRSRQPEVDFLVVASLTAVHTKNQSPEPAIAPDTTVLPQHHNGASRRPRYLGLEQYNGNSSASIRSNAQK